MLSLAVGMPRAGSGWHYNLIHDLIVASGGNDARKLRRKYLLSPFLTEVNLNIRALSPQRLWPVMLPALLGHDFAVKTHSGPSAAARRAIDKGRLRASYIYRDPRAALLSALEYGERARKAGRKNAFSALENFEDGLNFMQQYLDNWEAWMTVPGIHSLRYEDFLDEYEAQTQLLLDYLKIDRLNPLVGEVIAKHRPGKADKASKGQHFRYGEAERFRKALSVDELARANQAFAPYLERMGYSSE